MASIASTLAKLSMDVCMYASQNFSFLKLPADLTTGSSIMPHKQNPDVFELIRAKCNRIQALPNELSLMLTNLTSGYHRDLQLLKECLFPVIDSLMECLDVMHFMLQKIEVKDGLLDNNMYDCLFTVEEANRLATQG